MSYKKYGKMAINFEVIATKIAEKYCNFGWILYDPKVQINMK